MECEMFFFSGDANTMQMQNNDEKESGESMRMRGGGDAY